MISGEFHNIKISGVAAALPTKKIVNETYGEVFGENTVEKVIKTTGIKERYCAHEKQTASDLAFAAAEHLIKEKSIDPASINVLFFIGGQTDYIGPATSFVLQKRLGLSKDCIVFDMGLGCTAFVWGLYTISALLNAGNGKRGLFVIGDTTAKMVSQHDTSCMLFGDAGTAILVDKVDKTDGQTDHIEIGMKSDGNRFKTIIFPAGGFRMPSASREPSVWGDGILRSDYDLYMNGTDVFSFTMTDVPKLFKEFFEKYPTSWDDVDGLILHQANAFILRHLVKKVGTTMDKVPISLDRYGNSSGCTIPVTLCDAYGNRKGEKLRLVLSGFGIGLSLGIVKACIDTDAILPIIHTDDYYKDGYVSHE